MRVWWRWIGATALGAYAVLLVLAGWQPEVRPHALDAASETALGWFRAAGIRPGVAVFDDRRSDPGWEKRRFLCVQVRGWRADGSRGEVYEGDCAERTKLWFPAEEGMIYFLVARASGAQVEAERRGSAEPPDSEPLAALREHFRHRVKRDGGAYERYVLTVRDHGIDYRTGRETSTPVLRMAWRADRKRPQIDWPERKGELPAASESRS